MQSPCSFKTQNMAATVTSSVKDNKSSFIWQKDAPFLFEELGMCSLLLSFLKWVGPFKHTYCLSNPIWLLNTFHHSSSGQLYWEAHACLWYDHLPSIWIIKKKMTELCRHNFAQQSCSLRAITYVVLLNVLICFENLIIGPQVKSA